MLPNWTGLKFCGLVKSETLHILSHAEWIKRFCCQLVENRPISLTGVHDLSMKYGREFIKLSLLYLLLDIL